MRRKPSPSEWFAIGGTLLWMLAFFLPWYRTSVVGATLSLGAHQAGGLRWLLFLVALALLAYLVVTAFGVAEVPGPAPGAVTMTAGGVLSAATLAFALLIRPAGYTFSFGVFISLLGALAVVYGGFATTNEERAAGGGDGTRDGAPPAGATHVPGARPPFPSEPPAPWQPPQAPPQAGPR